MTQVISFGCKPTDNIYLEQVLPALLAKKKVSTIRPAWKMEKLSVVDEIKNPRLEFSNQGLSLHGEAITHETKNIIEKPPRFKVGEPVQFDWKQRSPHQWFCPICGMQKNKFIEDNMPTLCYYCKTTNPKIFPKILGTGIITEVLEIKIGFEVSPAIFYDGKGFAPEAEFFEELAHQEGFHSSMDFFNWFDKQYKLSTCKPKEFRNYRWRWDK